MNHNQSAAVAGGLMFIALVGVVLAFLAGSPWWNALAVPAIVFPFVEAAR